MKRDSFLFFVILFFCLNSFAQVPVMNPINGQASVCSVPNAGYSYTASASNSPSSYQWTVLSPSAGIVIANPNASVTNITYPNTNLNYTLMCTATNSTGTSAPVILIIKVYETPSVTFSGAQSFCQGSSTNLSASPTIISASSTLFYNWSPATGLNTTSGPTVNASPNVTTSYTVLLTMASCTNNAMVTVTYNPLPSFTPAISHALFCKLSTETLSINGNAMSYSINTVLTPSQTTLNYSVSGGVLITVIGESSVGCKTSSSITFSVGNCTIGINEIKNGGEGGINIYPNPSNGDFKIQNGKENAPIFISDAMGAIIRTYRKEKDEEIIVTGLCAGIYFISDGIYKYKILVYE